MFYVNGEEVNSVKDWGAFPPLDTKPRLGFNNQHDYKIAANGADGVIDEFLNLGIQDRRKIIARLSQFDYAIKKYSTQALLNRIKERREDKEHYTILRGIRSGIRGL